MKKTINSYNLLQGKVVTINWDDYCKDVIALDHHYMGDVMLLDKVRENAKKLGYIYERNLDVFDYEEDLKRKKNPPHYERFTVFTKIDTENTDEFPQEKIAIYRAYEYWAESWYSKYNSPGIFYSLRRSYSDDGKSVWELYKDYIRLFCGEEGFEYERIYSFNTINTILILVVDNIDGIYDVFFPERHKNYILFCLISTSSPHKIFIAPDLRSNKDSQYQKKIEELKFLLGIDETKNNL